MKLHPITRYLLVTLLVFAVAQSVQAGKLRRLLYNNYGGSNITNLYTTNLLGTVAFPDSPDSFDYLPPSAGGAGQTVPPNPPFLAQTEIHSGAPDNYGSLVEGYLTAPESGAYTFWLAADDEAAFYLNTDASDPLNPAKTNLICWVPGYSGAAEWAKFPEQQSAPVTLEQGKTYFLRILHKEGTGGDHIVLGWQTPSGVLERPMPAWHFQPVPDTRWFENDTEIVFGPVMPKTVNPLDPSLYDGMQAVAYVNINLPQPVTYQWLKGTTPLAGATNAYYLFRVNSADSYTEYSVRVISGGRTYTAGPAQVPFVIPDKPTLVSAGPLPQNPTRIRVVFSEDVSPATAANLANYTLVNTNSNTTITIQSATLGSDNRTVTLATPLLPVTGVYRLDVSNVQDMAAPANTMDPASTFFILADGSISFRIYYSNNGVTDLATLRTWSNTNSAAATYLNEAFDEVRLISTNSYPWNLTPLRDNYLGQMIGYLTAPESGNYKFAIASDDHSILYLGTNDLRTSKREICNYNGSTARWTLNAQSNQRSADVYLEAGKRYYFEAVYRDGTGSDGITVAWQTPSMTAMGLALPTSNPGVQSETEPFIIPAQYVSPFSAYGNVFFKTNLAATLSAAESTRPTLRVTADGTLPYAYQWFKTAAGVTAPIVGATASTYTLPFLRPADSGSAYFVVVTNNFSSVTSIVTALTVTSDTAKPAIASVGSLFKQTVEVRFSEPVSAATAGNSANYTLFNSAGATVAVSGVVIDGSDATHVTLQTAPLPETDLMKLAVQNVADISGGANVMNPATNTFRANNFDTAERINTASAWNVSANGDQITLTGDGSDVWGTADQCVFLHKTVTGNFDYKVQGVSLPVINSWSKMGLMARESVAAGSRNAFTMFTPVTPGQNTYSAQVRDATGAASTSSNDAGSPLNTGLQTGVAARPNVAYPSWLRLQRIGNSIYYYYGSNGTNWTFWTMYDSSFSAEGRPLPATLELGLALTSHDTARTVDGVMASFMAVNDGALRFALQPTNTTVVEGGDCTFAVTAAGGTPYYYQWLTNGIAMQDATNAALALTRVPFSWNGVQFACRLSNLYGESVTSTNALLTVLQDTNAPTVRYYVLPKINRNPTEVRLLYSEPMNRASAENLANYQITVNGTGTPLSILSALLDADERTVILTTVPQTAGTTYKVVVNNVIDQACCPPNPVPANSTDYFYSAGATSRFTQRADGFIIMEAENAQRMITGSTPIADWMLRNSKPGYSGLGYMVVTNLNSTGGGTTVSGGVGQGTGPAMEYTLNFTRPTTNYTLWVRGWVDNTSNAGADDSIFVGFDGNLIYLGPNANDVNYSQLTSWGAGGWDWRSDRSSGSDPTVLTNVAPGVHTLTIWMREDGFLADKIALEPGVRSNAGNSTEPSQASSNGGLGDLETWDYPSAPPAAPTISLINPTNTQTFPGGASITLEATAAGPSPIAQVDFFSNGALIGTATAAPYVILWGTVPEGLYSLTARVTDVLGYQTTSSTVRITVDSTKPVAYAVGSLRGASIGVFFTDLSGLDPVTAGNPANYLVNGGAVAVTNATLEPDNQAVMLALDTPISGLFSVQIANVADRGFGPNVIDAITLQSTVVTGLLDQDVGTPDTNNPALFTDPILPGVAQAIGTEGFYLRAGGHDVWDAADGFHFLYTPVTGDFDVAVRVASLLRTPSDWAKAGLMVRADLEGNSRNWLIASAPTNGQNVITLQSRPSKGVASQSEFAARPTPTPIPNCWLRMTRTNDVFSFYWGTNGTAWTRLVSTNLALSSGAYPATAYVGLATTSHNNGTNVSNLTTAYLYNLTGLVAPAPVSPVLKAQVLGSNLVLSWTSSDAGFNLQSTATVATGWVNDPAVPVVAGNTYTVTVPLGTGAKFYRLVK